MKKKFAALFALVCILLLCEAALAAEFSYPDGCGEKFSDGSVCNHDCKWITYHAQGKSHWMKKQHNGSSSYGGGTNVLENCTITAVEKAPTCTETGIAACVYCGARYQTSALGHTEAVTRSVAPTCTESGLTEGTHCAVCKEVLTAQETIPALGHTPNEDNFAFSAPTCIEDGYIVSTCTVCSETFMQVVPATGEHKYADVEAVEATDFKDGRTEGIRCAGCGDVQSGCEPIPAFCVIEDGVLTKYNGATAELVIPDNLGITKIFGSAFRDNQSLKSIVIPKGVTSIGGFAFYNCRNLTDVVIPEEVTSIGKSAFYACSSLTKLVIPDGLTSIGEEAFYACSSLTIYCNVGTSGAAAIKAYNLYFVDPDYPDFKIYQISNDEGATVLSIGKYIGADEEVVIPAAIKSTPVTEIGYYAFENNTTLAGVVIPDSVTSIAGNAFRGCRGLTGVVIPKSVASIGSSAFSNCSSLTSVVIPEGVASIDAAVFSDCSSLTSVVIPEGVVSIGNFAFSSCSSLTSVVIPKGVTSIGNYAFYACSSLTEVIIPEGVTTIGDYAFSACRNLTKVVIPEGVTSVGEEAFSQCSKLTGITIPASLTSFGKNPFGWSYIDLVCQLNTQGVILKNICISYRFISVNEPDFLVNIIIDENDSASLTILEYLGKDAVPVVPESIDGLPVTGVNCREHYAVILDAVAPTCTGTGLTEGKHCSVCGEVLTSQEVVPALGHTPSITQQVYEVNVGSEMYVSFTCLCGHNEASLVKWESKNADIAVYTGAPDHVEPGMITATFAGMSAGVSTVTADFVDEATEDCVFTIIVHGNKQMILPAMLRTIDEEAFMNAPVQEVILPEGMTVIGERAFANCAELVIIHMPDSIESIADDAFVGCENVTFICASENVAATYAAEHGIPCAISYFG